MGGPGASTEDSGGAGEETSDVARPRGQVLGFGASELRVVSYLCRADSAWSSKRFFAPSLFGLIRALDEYGETPPARIRNEGRQIKRMIGTLGNQLITKHRKAFLHHWGSWTCIIKT